MTTTKASPVIKFGCDPEFALFDKKINRLVSAHGLIPGTKAEPHKVPNGAIQVDGMMVEFNIDPVDTSEQFVASVKSVLKELRKYLPEDRYDFIYDPSIFFDPGYIKELPIEATELGCSPDYNAWHDGGVNPRPSPPVSTPGMRTCGGHIHISWTNGEDITDLSHRWDCCAIVRLLDTMVLPCLQMIEPDPFRRELYGKPGAFRPKHYGVEWRTPSNTWLKSETVQLNMITAIKNIVTKALEERGVMIPSKYEPMKKDSLQYSNAMGLFYDCQRLAAKTDTTSVVTGIRVASSSGRVNFDLNLDIVPVEKARLNYSNPNYVDESYLNPVIR